MRDLTFDDSFLRELPVDPETDNHRRQVFGAAASRVQPTPVAAPSLVSASAEVAETLALDVGDLDPSVLAGNSLLPGMDPYAACYGGHQFGNWAGQLGDGRAITLGEAFDRSGQRQELQLKGAGPTPYSRMGDGRAVMRSSVREFLCSEAMHHLGVPTTRALSLVNTGDAVVRDMFYDGHPKQEPGAIVCRVAPSFLRFGSFELPASRRDEPLLRRLAEYALATHFPHIEGDGPDRYVAWVREVCESTAAMVVHWMRVGFVHGVMNTDNMSILGLTIDYGPYGWLEGYEPDWTPNTTDAGQRRYRYGNQPAVAGWNLVRFASALFPLVGRPEPLEEALSVFGAALERDLPRTLRAKLGLPEDGTEPDTALVAEHLEVLQLVETDMTIWYRRLAHVPTAADATAEALLGPLAEAWYLPEQVDSGVRERTVAWLRARGARLREVGEPDEARAARMNAVNPKYVLRNYLAQLAIDAAEQGDGAEVDALLDVMRRPYDEQPGRERYAAKRPEWARHRPGCSTLSCSS